MPPPCVCIGKLFHPFYSICKKLPSALWRTAVFTIPVLLPVLPVIFVSGRILAVLTVRTILGVVLAVAILAAVVLAVAVLAVAVLAAVVLGRISGVRVRRRISFKVVLVIIRHNITS